MTNTFLKLYHNNLCSYGLRNLSSSEIAAALRPFYFVVHPDLFCQYPHEKKINENSLKSLKAYLEDNRSARNLFKNSNNTATVTFYLRKTHKNQSFHNGHFQKQTFDLFHNDVPSTVIDILKTCQLSTEYVEKLKSNIHDANRLDESSPNYGFYKPINDFPYHRIQFAQQKILAKHKKSANLTLRSWLLKNLEESYHLLLKTNPIRDEIARIHYDISNKIHVKDIIWDCSYGLSHKRGCFQSFQNLMTQHPVAMNALSGKTIVFSTQTGVSLDGHVILNIEDVRQKWLDVIKSTSFYDDRIKLFPEIENNVSMNLNGIKIGHRKFQPSVSLADYEKRLKKLVFILEEHKQQYPNLKFPNYLREFELVIECESGPLMLSPTGQIIAPCSYPVLLLLNFIHRNFEEAKYRMKNSSLIKNRENYVIQKCKDILKVAALEKDNSITPNKMIDCCERILGHFPDPLITLHGYRLIISNYYCVNQDGDMYIPWDWKI